MSNKTNKTNLNTIESNEHSLSTLTLNSVQISGEKLISESKNSQNNTKSSKSRAKTMEVKEESVYPQLIHMETIFDIDSSCCHPITRSSPLKVKAFTKEDIKEKEIKRSDSLNDNRIPLEPKPSISKTVITKVMDNSEIEGKEFEGIYDLEFEELMKINDNVIEMKYLKEKLASIDYYRNESINWMKSEIRKQRNKLKEKERELFDRKSKNWCVVCQRLARFHCCLRFYCSPDCQIKDWSNGHYNQCLTLEGSSDPFFQNIQ